MTILHPGRPRTPHMGDLLAARVGRLEETHTANFDGEPQCGCRTTHKRWEVVSLKKAQKEGMVPCRYCNPRKLGDPR